MSSLNSLIEKLATGVSTEEPVSSGEQTVQNTDPVYVEKLASAIDYIVDSYGGGYVEKTASVYEDNVIDISSALREKLQIKLAAKKTEGTNEKALAHNILSRLQELKHTSPSTEVVEDLLEEKTAGVDVASTEAMTPDDLEDLSLADILKSALSADELDESVPPEENVKTAEGRGETPMARKDVTNVLKSKLLAKLGQEAGHGTTR